MSLFPESDVRSRAQMSLAYKSATTILKERPEKQVVRCGVERFMPTPGEHKTVQARILAYAQEIGWTFVTRAVTTAQEAV